MMGNKSVLMIDNDHFSLSVLYRLVTDLGYAPLIGSTAEAALTLIDGQKPDVVIYNQDLESEWGVSLLERMKNSMAAKGVPVILLSQSTNRFMPRVEADGNTTVCFQKPIAIEPFVALFRELIEEGDTVVC